MTSSRADISGVAEAVWRMESARIIGALARWPVDGIPDNPAAWLMTVARNRALDHLRRSKLQQSNEGELTYEIESQLQAAAPDLDAMIDDDVGEDVFNECYSASAGSDWMRPKLCEEALRLGRILAGPLSHEPEVHGRVALMEIQSSRARARARWRAGAAARSGPGVRSRCAELCYAFMMKTPLQRLFNASSTHHRRGHAGAACRHARSVRRAVRSARYRVAFAKVAERIRPSLPAEPSRA